MKHRLFHLLPLARAAATLLLSVSALHAENGLRREVWHGLSAASEESLAKNRAFLGRPLRLTATPAYYAAPDGADILASAISPSLGGTSFGARLRGYLTAPTTGDYLFWDGGGDTVVVYLSTDENPNGKRLVVAHGGRKADQKDYQPIQQRSAPIPLVAGRKYYFEVIHTSETGQDGLDLCWRAPGDVRVAIPNSALEPYTPSAPNPAGLTREFFANIPGSRLVNLTDAPAFYRQPTSATVVNSSTFSGLGKIYGLRLRGYITAPESGEYTFWECGSGDVSVLLATEDNYAALHQSIRLNDRPNKKEIAHHRGATAPLEWNKYHEQQSKPVTLIAGKKYYLEVLFKTGEGPDHLSVAWQVPGGQPLFLPLTAMESYVRSATDLDDDGMPDALERASKLDPTDATDASGDLDGDGIFNDEEIRAGSNPAVRDSVPGMVIDDLWSKVPGDRLDERAYQVAFTRPISVRTAHVAMLIHHGGSEFVRRVRGFITPPAGGTYTFWLGSSGESSFSLSTTTSKFDRKLLISTTYGQGGLLGLDPSQKSGPVTLIGGHKYYFEIWHKHGGKHPVLQLGWQIPGEARETIASRYLSTYPGETNDQDDDDLADDWERANGQSTTDDGRSVGSRDQIDRLAIAQAAALGRPLLEDERTRQLDNPYFETGHFATTLRGDAYSASFGAWEKKDSQAWQVGRRGSVTYPVSVPRSGVYAIRFAVNSRAGGEVSDAYDFRISLNGVPISYQTVSIGEYSRAVFAVLTPWLNAGETYACEIFVDNSYMERRISVDEVSMLAAGGADLNGNGIPEWVETRLRENNGFDQRTIHSRTSPATVEGKARYLEMARTGDLASQKAPNGRFFAEVPLTPGAPANLEVGFENGGLTQTAKVHWQPTNLRRQEKEPVTIRQGDSLLLTAFRDDQQPEKETYTLTFNGETVSDSADRPTPVAFPAAGTQDIEFSHRSADGRVSSGRYTVNVLPRVALESPLCVTDSRRLWTHSPLPDGVQTQFDSNVTVGQEPTANTFTLTTAIPQNQPFLVRHGANGPILGAGEVKSVRLRSHDKAGNIYESFGDPISTARMYVVVTGDLDGAEIRCTIVIGGVTFDDGTTTKSLRATDFDELGVGSLLFLKANTAHANCRTFRVWKDGVSVGDF